MEEPLQREAGLHMVEEFSVRKNRRLMRVEVLTCDTERYLQLLKDNRVKGYLGEQQNYFTKQE